jgi:hypothetical protein
VSATRPSRERLPQVSAAAPSRDASELRARRRLARRRRRVARLDLGLGVLGAIVLLAVTPGLAISGLIALLVLAACGLSFILERRRRRRERASKLTSAARGRSSRQGRARGDIARDPRRSSR